MILYYTPFSSSFPLPTLSLTLPPSFLFILLLSYPPSSPSSLSLFFLLFIGVICKCENVATGD